MREFISLDEILQAMTHQSVAIDQDEGLDISDRMPPGAKFPQRFAEWARRSEKSAEPIGDQGPDFVPASLTGTTPPSFY